VKAFNSYAGVEHRLTLVERPQASGVERDVAEVKRFLISLCAFEGLEKRWSEPRILAIAEFLINNDPELPSNLSPYEMLFGRKDTELYKIISQDSSNISPIAAKELYVQSLMKDISSVRNIHLEHDRTRVNKETASNAAKPHNTYQPGDLVFKTLTKRQKSQTLQALRLGPFLVVSHVANDITIKNLITDAVQTIDMTRAVLFVGSLDEATELAARDDAQCILESIEGWRGDPTIRSSCFFKLIFEDKTTVWKPFCKDLETTTLFEQFCFARPMLRPLLMLSSAAKKQATLENKASPFITKVLENTFLDFRFLSHTLYQFAHLDLPDKYNTTYYLPVRVTQADRRKGIYVYCTLLGTETPLTQSEYKQYTCTTDLLLHPSVIVTPELLNLHPSIKSNNLPANWATLDPTSREYLSLFDPF
jgi:hypothetical protein